MLLNTNYIIISQLRTQSRQRITLLTTNRNTLNSITINNNYSNGGSMLCRVWDQIKGKCGEKLLTLGDILAKQCNFVMALRVRRMTQILGLYNRIYSESSVNALMSQLLHRLLRSRALLIAKQQNKRPNNSLKYLLSVACGVFCWDNNKISDRDMNQSVDEFVHVSNDMNRVINSNHASNTLSVSAQTNIIFENLMSPEWEPIIMKELFKVWRKPYKDSSLYKYKVYGTFVDIPARTFFQVQMDTDFRKLWDKLVITLDIIETEPNSGDHENNKQNDSGNEIIHWIMKYPYPMNSREYIYVRRSLVDTRNNVMVLVSKSIEHPKFPETNDHIRVYNYSSRMVIKPHKTFDDYGFDYMLTYYDDPRAAFPSPAYNWMASNGVPDFVEKLHSAALQLHRINTNKVKCTQKCLNNSETTTAARSSSPNSNYITA